VSAVAPVSTAPHDKSIALTPLGTYHSGLFNKLGAEIAAYDHHTRRLFITNVFNRAIDIVDISDPTTPLLIQSISVAPYGQQANSVAVHHGLVAAAVQATVKTDPGKVVFFDADGTPLADVTVGSLPDMITFTPDGHHVLVANEGEPNDSYTIDPEGSVSIIEVKHHATHLTQADVVTVGFSAFNGAALDPSIRIFGPGATVAQDLEPEYITVSDDSKTAWVTLQENNAIAELDIRNGFFRRVIGLGFKDHSIPGSGLDGSDRDGPANTPKINIAEWPVLGMYQPDAIASYKVNGQTYLVTANEGDSRDYPGFSEEKRVSTLSLDPTRFPNGGALKTNAQIGRLTVSTVGANPDGDTDVDYLFAFGARSFSIWTEDGIQVFDSGDSFEQLLAAEFAAVFNSDNTSNASFDQRSDNKGPEPEGVAVEKLWGRWYAFIGFERFGGVIVYDVTEPAAPRFVQYITTRNFAGDPAAGTAGDLGPEGLFVIPEDRSPTHQPLLVVANEVSGTTTIFGISKEK